MSEVLHGLMLSRETVRDLGEGDDYSIHNDSTLTKCQPNQAPARKKVILDIQQFFNHINMIKLRYNDSFSLSLPTLLAPEGESPVLVVTCSTQHFRGRPGWLLQVPNCPEPCRDVTERCRAWWAGAAWSLRLTWPKRECLLRLIASFMDSSCDRVATSTFVTNSYQRMSSIRLWFVIWKASSFAIPAFNSVHTSEAYSSDDRTQEL